MEFPEGLRDWGGGGRRGHTVLPIKSNIGADVCAVLEPFWSEMGYNFFFPFWPKSLKIGMDCAVPEKIPTHPMEGHWKFLGGGF